MPMTAEVEVVATLRRVAPARDLRPPHEREASRAAKKSDKKSGKKAGGSRKGRPK